MTQPFLFSLAELFPALPFAAEADRFLASCSEKSLAEQLHERRITKIEKKPMLSTAGLTYGPDQNLTVWINEYARQEWYSESLGHELGHTFHFDLSTTPPTPFFTWRDCSEEMYETVEHFCDYFAEYWRFVNDGQYIRQRIINSLGLIHLCYLEDLF
jgi:hypothetical protein